MKVFWWPEVSKMSVSAVGTWFLLVPEKCAAALCWLRQVRASPGLAGECLRGGQCVSPRGCCMSCCGRQRPVVCVTFVRKAGTVAGWPDGKDAVLLGGCGRPGPCIPHRCHVLPGPFQPVPLGELETGMQSTRRFYRDNHLS